jgi:hypothetical protein
LFFLGGFGFFGSIAEKSAEILEEIDLLSTLERRRKVVKQYFMYVLYGYVFIFSVYSFSKILLIIMGLPTPQLILESIYTALGFESILTVLAGTTLFLLKSFNYGVFSREYWKSLSQEESEDTTWRTLRRLFIIFLFVWAVYISFIVFFVEIFQLQTSLFTSSTLTYEDTQPIIHSLKLVFYITTTIQSMYFYTHIYKLVSALKSVDPNFKKKVDSTIKIDEDEEIKF